MPGMNNSSICAAKKQGIVASVSTNSVSQLETTTGRSIPQKLSPSSRRESSVCCELWRWAPPPSSSRNAWSNKRTNCCNWTLSGFSTLTRHWATAYSWCTWSRSSCSASAGRSCGSGCLHFDHSVLLPHYFIYNYQSLMFPQIAKKKKKDFIVE
jgi:hypothetical protein